MVLIFCLTSSWEWVGAALLVVERGVFSRFWVLVFCSFSCFLTCSREWHVCHFWYNFCTAFDQKLVILDFFVNDKVFHSFACLLTTSSSSLAAKKSAFIFLQTFPAAVWEVFLFYSEWALSHASTKFSQCC